MSLSFRSGTLFASTTVMNDMYEAVFRWPHQSSSHVILTGTFDQWSKSMTLEKGPSGFEGKVRIPWGTKVAYKFIVDGNWTTVDGQPAEPDPAGNWNNIYTAPPQPESQAPSSVVVVEPAAIISPSSHPVAKQEDDDAPPTQDPPATVIEHGVLLLTPPTADPAKMQGPTSESEHGRLSDLASAPAQQSTPTEAVASVLATAEQQQAPAAVSVVTPGPETEKPGSPPPPIAIEPPTPITADPQSPLAANDDTQKKLFPPSEPPANPNGTTTPNATITIAPASAPILTLGKKAGKAAKHNLSPSSSEDPSSSSRFPSGSFRAKRHSFLLKLKHIFTHDHSDDEKPKRRSSVAK